MGTTKWITTTPGAVVDYEYIKTHIRNMEKDHKFKIKEICTDVERNAIYARHGSGRVYDDRDTPRDGNFIRSYKDFREQVYQRRLSITTTLLNWATSNAITKQDANENIMLDKSKTTERIDPMAAVINSHVRCMLNSGEMDLNSYILSQDFSF